MRRSSFSVLPNSTPIFSFRPLAWQQRTTEVNRARGSHRTTPRRIREPLDVGPRQQNRGCWTPPGTPGEPTSLSSTFFRDVAPSHLSLSFSSSLLASARSDATCTPGVPWHHQGHRGLREEPTETQGLHGHGGLWARVILTLSESCFFFSLRPSRFFLLASCWA